MIKATADAGTSDGRTLVSTADTVAPKVQYQNRSVTDVWFAVIYVLSYIAFLACGFFVVAKSRSKYEFDENGDKQIAAHFMEDYQTCCSATSGSNNDWDICSTFGFNGGNRRLSAGGSKFVGDEGIFDAFIDAPEIIVGLIGLTMGIAIAWVVALRFFAKPIVILVELCKIAIFVVMGVYQKETGTKVICFLIAAGFVAYDVWARDKLMFAAKMITHSTIAMKENPVILFGGIFIKLLFAGNAALFVFFFAESFEVVEITQKSLDTDDYEGCYFESPQYLTGLDVYLSLSYLWTILLFDKMRLSIVANIVGSWHFHPEDRPSILVAIKNIGPSFGTLSVSALISSIAEYINRMLSAESCSSWISPTICITFPLHLLMCLFGSCLSTVVKMLTKFSVILHVFTGQAFVGSAKSVFNILSRHFKGGFVTEVTSKSVLAFGSYGFSIAIAMISWKWIDDRFDCGTLARTDDEDGSGAVLWILKLLIIFFSVWYPVLGLYVIIVINKYIQDYGKGVVQRKDGGESFNYLWIPPLAAAFVGCIAMMIFTFLSSIFLDTIDTLFLCYAIDKDNNVDLSDSEFESLVKEMPNYTEAEVVSVDSKEDVA